MTFRASVITLYPEMFPGPLGISLAGKALAEDYTVHRYHSPADELDDSWNFDGMIDTVDILYETGAELAYSDKWPNWYEGNEFRALRDAQRAGE